MSSSARTSRDSTGGTGGEGSGGGLDEEELANRLRQEQEEDQGLGGDELYEEEFEEVLDEEPKSLILSLIKQYRPGVDLSRIALPTFVLEPRSLLEKLTDFLAHPHYLVKLRFSIFFVLCFVFCFCFFFHSPSPPPTLLFLSLFPFFLFVGFRFLFSFEMSRKKFIFCLRWM